MAGFLAVMQRDVCWMKICSVPALARRRGENIAFIRQLLSAFADWQTHTATLEQRMARGYDINIKMRLPFTSISIPALVWSIVSTGDSVDLLTPEQGVSQSVALKLGLNYTPGTFAYHDRPAQTGRAGSVK